MIILGEQAIHATISGALAIQGVEREGPVRESAAYALQETILNTTDGGYDLLEGEYRRVRGLPRRLPIPTSPSAPSSISDIAEFAALAGVGDVDLDFWWKKTGPISLEGDTVKAGIAAHLFHCTEVR